MFLWTEPENHESVLMWIFDEEKTKKMKHEFKQNITFFNKFFDNKFLWLYKYMFI